MLRRIHFLAAVALCIGSYAMAATPSTGIVTAHDETKIDNYDVKSTSSIGFLLARQSSQSVALIRGLAIDQPAAQSDGSVIIYGTCKVSEAEPCCPHTAVPLCCPNYQYGRRMCPAR